MMSDVVMGLLAVVVRGVVSHRVLVTVKTLGRFGRFQVLVIRVLINGQV